MTPNDKAAVEQNIWGFSRFVSQQSFPSGAAQTAALSANPQPPGPAPPQAIQRLKDQNRLLTQV